MKEVSPGLRVINPEVVRQLDCKGSAVGLSCDEKGHFAGHCMGNVLQDFRIGLHNVTEEISLRCLSWKVCLHTRQLVLLSWDPQMSFRQFCMTTEERENRFKTEKRKKKGGGRERGIDSKTKQYISWIKIQEHNVVHINKNIHMTNSTVCFRETTLVF